MKPLTRLNECPGRSRLAPLAAALAALLLVPGCKPKPAPEASATAKAGDMLEVNAQDLGEVVERMTFAGVRVAGTLNPAIRVEVKAQVGGQLEFAYADRGTVVTQQQVLAVQQDLSTKAQVDSLKSQLAAAERDFGASELLFKAGAASERTFVNAKVSVDSAKAQLTQAQENQDRATVRSPIKGVISERLVSAGESVTPGQKLFTVVNAENLECAISVLPQEMAGVRIGQTAYFQLTSYPGMGVQGKVERIDPTADPKSRRVGVYVGIPNTNHVLFPGLFAAGIILTNETAANQKAVLVPSAAVLEVKGVQTVFAIEGEKLTRREVETLPYGAEEGMLEVRRGLAPGTKVLLAPAADLKDGLRVKLAEAGKAP